MSKEKFCPECKRKTGHKRISKNKDFTGWKCVKCGTNIITKGE